MQPNNLIDTWLYVNFKPFIVAHKLQVFNHVSYEKVTIDFNNVKVNEMGVIHVFCV